jgi:hypothetical protein
MWDCYGSATAPGQALICARKSSEIRLSSVTLQPSDATAPLTRSETFAPLVAVADRFCVFEETSSVLAETPAMVRAISWVAALCSFTADATADEIARMSPIVELTFLTASIARPVLC